MFICISFILFCVACCVATYMYNLQVFFNRPLPLIHQLGVMLSSVVIVYVAVVHYEDTAV